jgi:SpoVK/Ycf46/Vps4 family AAA+-type ATPase
MRHLSALGATEDAMNAEILRRVVRAIHIGSQPDLDRLASKIVDNERRTGHSRLADELQAILKQPRPRATAPALTADLTTGLHTLPTSRRHGELLTTLLERRTLEHHMVLPEQTEVRFARIESEFAARDRLAAFGLKPRKTILLYGPPGCGKSLGAKRLAWNTGLPLLKVRFDVLISSYFGESAANLRSIFSAAKERPCVLLLDECDFIARSRTNSKDIGEASRIVNALLQQMEEYDAPGLLVATTNIESSLDSALFRRFDDVFLVPPPGLHEIELLLKLTLSGVKLESPMPWEEFAKQLIGASAATVVKAAQDAAKAAILSGRQSVAQAQITQSVAEMHRNEAFAREG